MKLQLSFFSLLIFCACLAQDTRSYTKMSESIADEVWGDNDPMFTNNQLPNEYKNESAVILAQKQNVETSSRISSTIFSSRLSAQVESKHTIHKKIFINDKVSLDYYSTLTFDKLQIKRRGLFLRTVAYTFIGLRIIKSNGVIEKVNIDEEGITIRKRNDGTENKIAIPNLMVGDILEYYVAYYDNKNVYEDGNEMIFVLGDEYPIINYRISVLYDKSITPDYQSINGAPDFRIKNDKKSSTLNFTAYNIPKYQEVIWTSLMRQIPIARIKYKYKGLSNEFTYVAQRSSLDAIEVGFRDLVESLLSVGQIDNQFTSYWEKINPSTNSQAINSDSLASVYFYYVRNKLYGKFKNFSTENLEIEEKETFTNQLKAIVSLMLTLDKSYKVSCDLLLVSGKKSVKRNDIFSYNDVDLVVRINSTNPKYCYFGSNLYLLGEVPISLENEKSISMAYKLITTSTKLVKYASNGYWITTIPNSLNTHNFQSTKLQAKFSDANNSIFEVSRYLYAMGNKKKSFQKSYLSREDFIESESKNYNAPSYKKYEDSLTKYFSESDIKVLLKNSKKDAEIKIDKELNEYYNFSTAKRSEFKILNHGLSLSDSSLKIYEKFTVSDCIKKAGSNSLIEIGKLIGNQIELTPKERERTLDIYCLQEFGTTSDTIELAIPTGYVIDGIERLNKKLENECGSFISSATLKGNNLFIIITKSFFNSFEKVSNWKKILEILDVANEFQKQKILLKK